MASDTRKFQYEVRTRKEQEKEQKSSCTLVEDMREQPKATGLVHSPRKPAKSTENDVQTTGKAKSALSLAKGSDSSTSSICLIDGKQKRKSLQPLQLSADGQKLLIGGGSTRKTKSKKRVKEPTQPRSRQSKLSIPLRVHEETEPSSSSEQESTTRSDTTSDVPTSSDEAYALMVQGQAPEKYWELVAEERRKALEETLQENMKLYQIIEELKVENKALRLKANHTDYFATMYKVAKAHDVLENELASV